MELIIYAGLFMLGAVFASFVAVLAERVHTGTSWIGDRSRCNSCAEVLGVRDLVPVFSWMFRLGRARCCGARVPMLYVIGELVLGSLFALAYFKLGLTLALPAFLLFLCVLAFIVLYDLRHTVVPTISSALLIFSAALYQFLLGTGYPDLRMTLIAAALVGLAFFLAYALSRGRAMGLGDAPVALALALLVGSTLALPGLLFSFWIGGLVGIIILVRRPKGRRMGIEVPFVPFLAAGYLLAYFTQWNPLPLPLW